MLVKDWMSTEVVTVNIDGTVQGVINLFMRHNPSIVPVVREGKAVGLITQRDLRKLGDAKASWIDVRQIPAGVWHQKVDTIMSREIIAVPPDYTVEETSELLLDRRIPGCPVLDHEGRVVGIITKKDLLKAFTEASALPGLGILFGLLVQDRTGCINSILNLLRRHDARVMAIMSSYANAPEGFRRVYIRCFHMDRGRIQQLHTELDEVGKTLFIVDRKAGTREIFSE